jgi:1,4-dihydroxy-2-naphthoyl-CoA hydrolase
VFDPATTIPKPLTDGMDPEFLVVTRDEVAMAWTVTPELHQPYGIVHGGVHSMVVEGLASIAAGIWLGEDGNVVGVNNSTDFYRAVSDGRLTSRATPVHRGRLQQVWVVETRDQQERLVARGQVRLQNLPKREG